MNKRFAVMDLGTNTFHLLIVEIDKDNIHTIAHEHVAVKLGEGGINKNMILTAALERAISTMRRFSDQIKSFNVQRVKAIGTSALRNASNGFEFVERVKAETGIAIEIINGNAEAVYIYKGVKASGTLSDQNSLIIDIGGGSVEFIIANSTTLIWKQSFEIGAARLMDMFHHADPISPMSIEAIEVYLKNNLTNLFNATESTPVSNIIGSSGAFETFAELAEAESSNTFDLKEIKTYSFNKDNLLTITGGLIGSTHAEREQNKHIIPVRVDMIVVASIFTRYIVEQLQIQNVMLSTYSLKEGVLAELMNN